MAGMVEIKEFAIHHNNTLLDPIALTSGILEHTPSREDDREVEEDQY